MNLALRAKYYLEYAFVRVFVAGVLSLGYERALGLARALADLGFRIDKRHRERAIENLSRSLPELGEAEWERLARESFRSFAQVLVESAYLPRLLTERSADRLARFHVHPKAAEAAAAGTGLIFITAHTGNWELTGQVAGINGFPLVSVARPRDNPWLEDYVIKNRERHGQKIVAKRGAVRELARALRDGKNLGILADQNSGGGGVFVEYFGRLASTTGAPATLALRFKVPILPGFSVRAGKGFSYDIYVEEPLVPPETGNREEDVRILTAEFTRRIENVVRAHPEQWLWGHRRWKSRPKEEQSWRSNPSTSTG
jgi:KDO2-lipid IV(A) lauroyltransferase